MTAIAPTIRQLPPAPPGPLRRSVLAVALGLGTLIAGAGLSAAPAMAATQSTCLYNESNQNVIINDFSGSANLRILTADGVIGVAEGAANMVLCRSTDPTHT